METGLAALSMCWVWVAAAGLQALAIALAGRPDRAEVGRARVNTNQVLGLAQRLLKFRLQQETWGKKKL